MTSFDKINRRTHLYLGLVLMPWLLMYGVSSFMVIHQPWFGADKQRARELLYEKDYRHSITNETDLRSAAQEILKECHLEGAFWVDKPNPETLHIERFSFWDSTSLTYSMNDGKLKVERQKMKVPQAIIRMHFRGGYGQPIFWDKLWGTLVDCACVGIIIWVLSGLVMWWRLPRFRAWGAIAVGAGVVSFLLLILTI